MAMPARATTSSATLAPAAQTSAEPSIKVMVVDDSAVVRGLVSRWLEEEPGIEVVARHPNGKLAILDVARSGPDLILLDIDMPVMDGLQALPLLLHARPEARVLMVSTLTKRNAEISFKALSLGALDYLPKPETNHEITLVPDFRLEVIRKVSHLAVRNDSCGAADRTPPPKTCRFPKAVAGWRASGSDPSPWCRRA
jgi:two-component system chemotaxis response regulator CheB